jgi:hypothetical protein
MEKTKRNGENERGKGKWKVKVKTKGEREDERVWKRKWKGKEKGKNEMERGQNEYFEGILRNVFFILIFFNETFLTFLFFFFCRFSLASISALDIWYINKLEVRIIHGWNIRYLMNIDQYRFSSLNNNCVFFNK